MIYLLFNFYSVLFSQEINPDGYNYFYHSNGNISSEGSFKNNLPEGLWISYNVEGVISSKGFKKEGLSDSTWFFYDEKGRIKNLITYDKNLKNGVAQNFDTLGNVIEEFHYKNGLIQGEKKVFYETGELKETIPFVDGKESGESFEYDEKGEIITEKIYDGGFLKNKKEINRIDENGNKTGYWRELHPNGKLKSEINYKEGEIVGLLKEYDEKGRITEVKNYYQIDSGKYDTENIVLIENYIEYFPNSLKIKLMGGLLEDKKFGVFREYDLEGNVINGYIYNYDTLVAQGIILSDGNYEGEWTIFYSNGNILAKGTYENGRRNGLWTYYYENGKIEQIGKFTDEIPSGEWKWYYPNGQIKAYEFYRKGKIEGTVYEYDEQGNEITKGDYYNGIREGVWFYHINNHKETGEYTMGLKNGLWKHYYKNGKLEFIGNFDEGQPKGKHTYYHPNGVKKKEGKYLIGKENGIWKVYSERGEILEVLQYKRGKLVRINGEKVVEMEINDE